MVPKIILVGKEEQAFQFVQRSLNGRRYRFQFLPLEALEQSLDRLAQANLIILDTCPFSENDFPRFTPLFTSSQTATIPVLALVKAKPPRLRYRLIDLGSTDYLVVPFDPLDLEVRVKNLLRRSTTPVAFPTPSAPDTFTESDAPREGALQAVLRALSSLHQRLNQSLLTLEGEQFLTPVLESIRRFCAGRVVLLFDVQDENTLKLRRAYPEGLMERGASLDVEASAALVKAVRLQQPTVLNRISTANPFVARLSKRLNLPVTAFMVYPIILQKAPRSVLVVLKSDGENFSDLHFLLVENFAQFIAQSFYLDHLQEGVKSQLDQQIWKYSYEFLDQVVNQLSFGIVVVDRELRIKYLNRDAAQLMGVSTDQALYRSLREILNQNVVQKILDSLEEDPTYVMERPELELQNTRGEILSVGFSVRPFTDHIQQEEGYIISLKDITYAKEIQEEMRRVDRLASLGVMASGIAHEIRNPLAGIKAVAQTLEEEFESGDPRQEYLRRIIRQVNRLDDMLRSLFSYARPPRPNRRLCHIETVLTDVISLLRQKIKEQNVRLIKKLHPHLPQVYVDPGQIQQVLMNLLLNSIEAVRDDGEVTIAMEPFYPHQNGREKNGNQQPYLALLRPEPYLKILIRDNGCGIPREHLKNIFNPFFTTKPMGTGLGLFIVYQIVKENDGVIHFESEVGRGTDCYLFLPVGQGARKDVQQGNPL
ncbi:MAG: PAS domain S-box protein [Calditrichaeota bacterium]|nr:MAG: PAS domain S-box protein [Calditrichota bacterium]